ncbi:glucose transporter type 1 isoform X2 [Centruroides vittatus]|uniref:glucose transporter type 1 isoform X2 n=1 Tax=Centruroides vittatus TaxID=120091 RepID=UPI00350FECF7
MCCCPEGATCMLVFSICAAVLGMFQFGYNTGVVNAPQNVIKEFIADIYKTRTGHAIADNFKDLLWAITVSVFAIGGMVGGISGGSIADKFGRKGGLLLNNITGIVGAGFMGFSKISRSVELLIIGRLIIGFNCGLNTALVPMYLSEIAPLTLRGGLALVRLRCSNHVEDDLEEMKAEERAQQQEAQISMWQLICSKSLQLPLIIGVVMQLSQQLSGINAVFYYSTGLFTAAGLSQLSAMYATIGVGAVMVIMTLVSIPFMDRAGRRTLHLYGLGGMFIFSIFITISLLVKFLYHWVTYLSVISTLAFVVFFAIGPGSIPWMITAELFSQGPRPAAMSIAVLVNWFANFTVGLVFPQMQRWLENYTFLPFTFFLAIFWTFTYKKVPETKNKTFEEISALFRRDEIININGVSIPKKSLQGELVFEEKPVETYGTFQAGGWHYYMERHAL